jgi:hypothetical protein
LPDSPQGLKSQIGLSHGPLAVVLHERRLVVEQIDVTRRPGHEHLHHPFCFGRMMNDLRRTGSHTLVGQHARQRNPP